MNIAMRKLALLEENILKREEAAKLEGYTSCPIVDCEFREKLTKLMDKIRVL